jgi:crossover junction endodeoxyribonuclease RuvC
MIYIGIDPGLGGAVAVINGTDVKLFDTPTAETGKGTKRDYLIASMSNFLYEFSYVAKILKINRETAFCVLEAVHSMPKQGVVSSFSFGRGLGIWEGILSAYNISYVKVSPQTWKKAMLADMPRDNKDSSRIAATRLFPNAADMLSRKKDDGRAEALLMGEYGRRLTKGL